MSSVVMYGFVRLLTSEEGLLWLHCLVRELSRGNGLSWKDEKQNFSETMGLLLTRESIIDPTLGMTREDTPGQKVR